MSHIMHATSTNNKIDYTKPRHNKLSLQSTHKINNQLSHSILNYANQYTYFNLPSFSLNHFLFHSPTNKVFNDASTMIMPWLIIILETPRSILFTYQII